MKKRYIFAILLLVMIGVFSVVNLNFKGKANQEQQQITTEQQNVEVIISKENLYASVQHHMEWGLYEQYADYYLNYMSQEQTDYYNCKADVQEIFNTLKEIYCITFDYNSIELKEEQSKVELSIPVQVMNQTYQYVYVGEIKNDQNYEFHKAYLYQDDGKDIFSDMEYSRSVKVKPTEQDELIQEGSLQNPNQEYVSYYALWEFLNQEGYVAGEKITSGLYFHNGDLDGAYYIVRDDGKIAISTQQGNLWNFKTLKEGNKNYLCYGYNLTGYGIDGGYRIEYTKDSLIVDGEVFQLKK